MTTLEAPPTLRTCTACGEAKPRRDFSANAASPDGLRPSCRACAAKHARRYLLFKRFGITEAEFDRRLARQGGVCALCASDKPGGRWENFHVDHCHRTGRIRGLLCYPCNASLGVLGDSPQALLRAYLYVSGLDENADYDQEEQA